MNFQVNRALVFAHRWGGIFLCMLVVLWFFSGMVMLYVGYPKLTPAERLAALPVLDDVNCCVPLRNAWLALPADAAPKGVQLTTVAGKPIYKFELHHGYVAVDARSGSIAAEVTPQRALDSARAFMPGAEATYVARVDSDIWTRGSRLNPHRPLHRVQMHDAADTVLYISSTTGEVVRDAPAWERRWNFVGPWLHWLHAFRSPDGLWRVVIIGTSLTGIILALTGLTLGIMRWRFKGSYGSGRKTPYREPYMRWHHVTGLLFAAITLTWIFSGLMSVNPWGVFGGSAMVHDAGAAAKSELAPAKFAIDTAQALSEFRPMLAARELEWHVLNGKAYFVARDGAGRTRILFDTPQGAQFSERLPTEELTRAASGMLPGARVVRTDELQDYDEYYYGRAEHTLRGSDDRRLPVVRVQYADSNQTWVYLDPYTGAAVMWVDSGQRAQRWWFLLLHSWDTRPLLAFPGLRDAVLLAFCLGGVVLGVTGTVIGYRRVRNKLRA
jgi:uncharacterized iron-regulated membrane protein